MARSTINLADGAAAVDAIVTGPRSFGQEGEDENIRPNAIVPLARRRIVSGGLDGFGRGFGG